MRKEINFREYLLSEIDLMIEDTLRNNVSPPIKGEITKGKIKWRGLKLVQHNDYPRIEIWVEQRGKKVSRPLIVEFKVTGE